MAQSGSAEKGGSGPLALVKECENAGKRRELRLLSGQAEMTGWRPLLWWVRCHLPVGRTFQLPGLMQGGEAVAGPAGHERRCFGNSCNPCWQSPRARSASSPCHP